ncbi:MAG: hypothetical protein ACYTGH_06035 [Planctomycetota bacterium]
MKNALFALVCLLMLAAPLCAEEARPVRIPSIDELAIRGVIDGRNLTFTLDFEVKTVFSSPLLPLIQGDVVLDTLDAGDEAILQYGGMNEKGRKGYLLGWKRPGTHTVSATFAARAQALSKGSEWKQAIFTVPGSRVRNLQVTCNSTDLEILFPGALRVHREVKNETLTVTAILGPGKPFCVRWKPQVQELDGELVLSSRVNSIAHLSPSALRVDSLFSYMISQGKLEELRFQVPKDLSITQVRGASIRNWLLSDGAKEGEEGLPPHQGPGRGQAPRRRTHQRPPGGGNGQCNPDPRTLHGRALPDQPRQVPPSGHGPEASPGPALRHRLLLQLRRPPLSTGDGAQGHCTRLRRTPPTRRHRLRG